MKQRIAYSLLLVAAVFAVYFPSLYNGFVWDDTALVIADPFIRSWRLIPEGFRHFLFTDATASDFYRPLQRLTYTWDYAWFGFKPWAFHLTNILIHAAAAVALFLFLGRFLALPRKAGESAKPALLPVLAAGVWAIHPLHSSAVCYISGRADLLAGLCGFLALWLSLGESREAILGAALFFLGALLSKESAVVFLPLCVAVRLFAGRTVRLWALMLLLVAGCYAFLRFTAEHSPPPPGPALSWLARPIVALRALAEYAGLLIAPFHLHMERDILPFGRGDFASTLELARQREFQTLLGALLLAGLAAWLRWAARRDRAVLAALICFIAAYLPVCGLFSLNASVAEHWLYVPSAFLLPAAMLSLPRLRTPLSPPAWAALLAVWAASLGVRTFLRNDDWRDQRIFLERTIADGGGSARMYINRAALESSQGRQDLAIADYQKALTLQPDQSFALLGLGAAYLKERHFEQARAPLLKAMESPLLCPEAMDAYAVLEYQQNRVDDLDILRRAAEMDPFWQVRKRYVLHLADRGNMVAAITFLRAITEDQPWRGESWRLLGDFWMHVRQYDFAARAYRKAMEDDVHDDVSAARLEAVRELQGGG